MEFINRVAKSSDINEIVSTLTQNCEKNYDLGLLFISHQSPLIVNDLVIALKEHVNIKTFIGCTSAGIISSNSEVEDVPAVSLLLAKLPNVNISPFSLTQSQLEGLSNKKDLYQFLEIFPNEEPVFLIFPDPFLLDMNYFLKILNDAYPQCPVIGGLASAANEPRGNTLFLNNENFDEGVIGLILTGNINVMTVVSQGCRPIGETYIATKTHENVIHELAGKSFIEILKNILDNASDRDKLLVQESLFVGIAIDEYKHEYKRGDFLIRGLMGIDQNTGSGIIGDYVKAGQTVQFHVRDAQAATEDLNELLIDQQQRSKQVKPKGALIFSCNGRGEGLFREKNHDINIIQGHVGPIPTGGFFCAGEIGPIGKSNFLHGFTSSIAFFYPKKT